MRVLETGNLASGTHAAIPLRSFAAVPLWPNCQWHTGAPFLSGRSTNYSRTCAYNKSLELAPLDGIRGLLSADSGSLHEGINMDRSALSLK